MEIHYNAGAMTCVPVGLTLWPVAGAGVVSAVVFVAVIVGSFAACAWVRPRWAVALAVGGLVAVVAVGPAVSPDATDSYWAAVAFFELALVALPAAVGMVFRLRAGLRVRLAEPQRVRLGGPAGRARQRLAAGIADLASSAPVDGREDVERLEAVARACLSEVRVIAHDLRSGDASAAPPATLEELGRRLDQLDETRRRDVALARRTLVSGRAVDVVLAVLAVTVAIATAWSHADGLVEVGLAMLSGLPIAVARRHLASAAAVSVIGCAALTLAVPSHDPLSGAASFGIQMAFPFLAGAQLPRRRGLIFLAGCAAAAACLPALASISYPGAEVAGALAVQAGCFILGAALQVAARSLLDERLHGRRRDVDEARAALARDVHDTAAHSMTVVVLQAAAARRVWDTDPIRRAEHVAVLCELLDVTLPQLHSLGSRLDDAGPENRSELAASVDAVIAAARRSGQPVRFEESSLWARTLPLGVLVVQEALTNAARYAPDSEVRLRCERTRGGVRIEVTNPPAATTVDSPSGQGLGSGLGLRGLAERAAAAGGRFHAAVTPDGGFGVTVVLPLQEAPPEAPDLVATT
jgi:signal transduction histidine kinase